MDLMFMIPHANFECGSEKNYEFMHDALQVASHALSGVSPTLSLQT
jgi:hypothetical protein